MNSIDGIGYGGMNSSQPSLGNITGSVDSATIERDASRSVLVVTVQGWLFHTGEEVVDLYFEAPGAGRSRVTRTARPDIAEGFPQVPYARESGYSVSLEFSGQNLSSPLTVTVFATLKSGARISTAIQIPLELPKGDIPGEAPADLQDDRLRQVALRNFLASGRCLCFPAVAIPKLSIIIVTFNNAHDTFACLSSLQMEATSAIEIIIIDNNSTDQTTPLLNATSGLRIIKNRENLHFLRAAIQGAASAAGELLLFLNNDTVLLPGALQTTIESFKNHPRLGVLGARLIHLNGKLQEVGGSVLPDGSTIGNGVGEHPLAVPYLLQRSVDYCSGAFLATPRELWIRIGGFDLRYSPAYYEDVDYCISAQELGFEVLIEPRITVLHAEGAVGNNSTNARQLMLANRQKFAEKHAEYLKKRPHEHPHKRSFQPPAVADTRNVLIIDDFFPRTISGQGAPRSRRIVDFLISQGCRITFVALNESLGSSLNEIPDSPALHCRAIFRGTSLLEFLALNAASYGTIIISRPHNMEDFHAVRSEYPICASNASIIYDAEAVFALREIRKQQRLQKVNYTAEEIERIVSQEILRVKKADQFWAVSEAEALEFLKRGLEPVRVLGYGVEVSGRVSNLSSRSGLLFVGPIVSTDTPNGEGFAWYKSEVLPYLRAYQGPGSVKTTHVGIDKSAESVRDPLLLPIGQMNDLFALYQAARVFVAPVHFGSGIPIKVIEAVAHGLPIVTTSYVASQLGWNHGEELLIADEPMAFSEEILRLIQDDRLWLSLHERARERVKREYCLEQFHRTILESLPFT
jgi:GT2 family glycosyltransferase